MLHFSLSDTTLDWFFGDKNLAVGLRLEKISCLLFQMVAIYDKGHFNLSYSFTASWDYKNMLEIVPEINSTGREWEMWIKIL